MGRVNAGEDTVKRLGRLLMNMSIHFAHVVEITRGYSLALSQLKALIQQDVHVESRLKQQ